MPVCRPSRDHSVSPWRMMKARGVVIADGLRRRGSQGGGDWRIFREEGECAGQAIITQGMLAWAVVGAPRLNQDVTLAIGVWMTELERLLGYP